MLTTGVIKSKKQINLHGISNRHAANTQIKADGKISKNRWRTLRFQCDISAVGNDFAGTFL